MLVDAVESERNLRVQASITGCVEPHLLRYLFLSFFLIHSIPHGLFFFVAVVSKRR
jgi:hypothetical protein